VIKWTYDSKADAAYIYLASIAKGEVASSQLVLADNSPAEINLDFDESGKLLGIEILFASKILKKDFLRAADQL